jgi:hypothetical protein
MPKAAKLPFINPPGYLCAHRIVRHIHESFDEFSHVINDFGKKPLSPYMTAGEMLPIPRHCEYAQYPLHNTRQGLSLFRVYYEMDMVAHNAKIMDLETKLLFCPLYSVDKECLHGLAIEDHLLSVCPCGNVIRGIGPKNSISPHTVYTGAGVQNALVDFDFFSLKCRILSSVPNYGLLSTILNFAAINY